MKTLQPFSDSTSQHHSEKSVMGEPVLTRCFLSLLFGFFSCFQNNVEIHVAHIQSGLSQLGNLHAFAANNTNAD